MKDNSPTTWDLLEEIAARGGEPVAAVVPGVSIFPAAEYLDLLIPRLTSEMLTLEATALENWREFVGIERSEDIRRVLLPQLASALRKYAADGSLQHGFAAASLLMFCLLRELIRQGQAPVLCAFSEIPVLRAQEVLFE